METARVDGVSAPRRTLPRSCRTEVVVDVPAEALWRVIADVTRVGEWSHECRTVQWLGQANAAVPGARFRGRNRSGSLRWARVCEIMVADPPRELRWRTVPSGLFPDLTEWRIALEPVGDGTRIVQSFEVLRIARWLAWLIARVNSAHRDRAAALTGDLHRLAAVAAADPR
ncbi:hypothetical protein GCM10023322_48090 [Rugosimonospora acidiphila]|uniref:SRPBCC family protein n=1 Tax=Rugosimonospora acidiphila TaxID=556531 RepID=A0ABP9S5S5_9ACTN